MFTTFSTSSATAADRSHDTSAPRAKRAQVARACDYCRLNRVKCDDRVPCRNCENRRGGTCTRSRSKDSHALSVAREKQLEARLKDLENQLQEAKARDVDVLPATPTSLHSTTRSHSKSASTSDVNKRGRGGASENTPASYHGLSSAAYFLARINSHLAQSTQEHYDPKRLQPLSASTALASPASTLKARPEFGDGGPDQFVLEELNRSQEQMFLNLYWHHHHLLYPILFEADFEEHYESLWADLPSNRPSRRRSSPLIDAMLAICMQHGAMIMTSRDDEMDIEVSFTSDDATIAGRGYFTRCQRLLEYELEEPSVTTLQCLIFSTLFLWDASFVNQADQMLAKVVRVAYTLGLDQTPTESLDPGLRNLRRRLWWAVHIIDTKISLAVGRQFLTHVATFNCFRDGDPKDDSTGSLTQCPDQNSNVGRYDYFAQCAKLVLAVRRAFSVFDERCAEFEQATGPIEIQRDPKLIESLASLMPKATKEIEAWVEQVPTPLKSNSSHGNKPFAPHRSAIDLKQHQPHWLQRQRIHLVLQYHEFAMLLFRPFTRVPPTAVSITPLSDGIATTCLKHSIAITSIIQQVQSETDILKGCHQAYCMQWNATLSIFGWVLGNPLQAPAPAGRKALQASAATFDSFGNSVAFAKSAAAVVRDMAALTEQLVPNVRSTRPTTHSSQPSAQSSSLPPVRGNNAFNQSAVQQRQFEPSQDFMPLSQPLGDDLYSSMVGFWPMSMPMTVTPDLLSIDPLTSSAMSGNWGNAVGDA